MSISRKIGLVFSGLLLGVLSTWFVSAAFSASSSTPIVGCVSNNGGALRIVKDGSECNQSETPLSWAQEGPPGAAGAPGPQGPAGASTAPDRSPKTVAAVSRDLSSVSRNLGLLDRERESLEALNNQNLGLQMAMDRVSKFMQNLSNIEKKNADSARALLERET
jgi:hypothetical protein